MSETTDQELSSFIVVARIANYSGHAVWRKLLALTADLVTHLRWGFHFLHLNTVNGWRDLEVIDSQIANLLERAKVELRSLPTPESCCDAISHLTAMRQGGLIRLLRQLDANGA